MITGTIRDTDHKNFASSHAVLDETYPAGTRFLNTPSAIENFKVNVHQTLAHAALFYAIADILLDKQGRGWSSEFQMVAQGYMAEVKGQMDDMRLKRDPNLPPSNKLDSYTETFSNDLFGEMTVTRKDASLNLKYGVNTATLEHWQGDTFLAHWNLKGLMDDSMIAFSPHGKSMTLLNDRVEYGKTL